jgi:hypothetical protein
MVDHFRLEAAADVSDARGLRDWDVSELINQGLPLPREVDGDMLPKRLKQNLQLLIDPREDDPVSSPYSLGEVRDPRPAPPLLRRLGRLRDPLQTAVLLNDLLTLPDYSTTAQNRPQSLASSGRHRWLPGSYTDIVASKGWLMALGSLQVRESPPGCHAQDSDILKDLSEPIWTCIANVLRTITLGLITTLPSIVPALARLETISICRINKAHLNS